LGDVSHDLGYEVGVRALKLGELLDADEAFLTGTAIEITPIREIDGRAISSGARGHVVEAIQKTFFDIVSDEGRDTCPSPKLDQVGKNILG
jgi:branched-chain amino acid aminotransferase